METLKHILTVIGVLLIIIFSLYFLNKTLQLYYSSKYNKGVPEYLMRNSSTLIQENMDTIFVTDNDFHECSNDPRGFIDKQITRPSIRKQLEKLGYKTIIFAGNNPEISVNGGQPIGISSPVIREDKPCYGIHIWTDTYGLFPKYEITIEETYFIKDSITTDKTSYIFSVLGDEAPEYSSSKEQIYKYQ